MNCSAEVDCVGEVDAEEAEAEEAGRQMLGHIF
jgi:hypothetical protein